MKTLAVILTLIVTLLAATLSSPTAHAMPMDDAASITSMSHECCDSQTQQSAQHDCEDKSVFCQHCEQHCAGQIGLLMGLTELSQHHYIPSFSRLELLLWQRAERLIRPPKLIVV